MNVICSWHVANSFIRLSFVEKIYITPLKLNCLLFLLYSNYLYNTGDKLFNEYFVKNKKGPVLINVDAKFSCWGNDIIREYAEDAVGNVRWIRDNSVFDASLFYVWNLYKNMSDTELLSFLKDNYLCLQIEPEFVINDIDILNDEIKINEKALEKAKYYKKTLSRNFS